jgi:hypothetical protein
MGLIGLAVVLVSGLALEPLVCEGQQANRIRIGVLVNGQPPVRHTGARRRRSSCMSISGERSGAAVGGPRSSSRR